MAQLANAEMMRHIACFGVAPWGYVQHTMEMEKHINNSNSPFEYDTISPEYVELAKTWGGKVLLDPNHTHFLLADNGSLNKYGYEHIFRADVEQHLASKLGSEGTKVPHVVILFEGGKAAIEFVAHSLELGTPAVVVNGSGRIADCLATAWKVAKSEMAREAVRLRCIQMDEVCLSETKIAKIVAKAVVSAGYKDDYNDVVIRCLSNFHLITVFDPKSASDLHTSLDVAIYDAHLAKVARDMRQKWRNGSLDARGDDLMRNFQNAFDWRRVEFARILIQQSQAADSREWKSLWSPCLADFFERALIDDMPEFVSLFFEVGMRLKEKFTMTMLVRLYQAYVEKETMESMRDKRSQRGLVDLTLLLMNAHVTGDSESNCIFDQLREIDVIHKRHFGEFYQTHFLEAVNQKQHNDCCCNCRIHSRENSEEESASMAEYVSAHPYPDIFVWATLMGFDDMADIFLTHVKYPIAACLVACNHFQRMAESTNDAQRVEKLKTKFERFENHAIGILNACYAENPLRTSLMMVQNIQAYGNTSCLKLAVQGKCMNFMGHQACQSQLNSIWHGSICTSSSTIALIFCYFLPFFIPLLISFREDLDNKDFKMECTIESWYPLTKVGVSVGTDRRRNVFQKIISFYKAPIIKMFGHLFTYCLFLLFFSIHLIFSTENKADKLIQDDMEIIVFIYWTSYIVNEISQMSLAQGSTVCSRVVSYLSQSLWNLLDIFIVITIVVVVSLRVTCFSLDKEGCQAAHSLDEIVTLLYVFNFMLFFLRILPIFYCMPKFGPMLFMIWRMLSDLTHILLIFVVFMGGYGVASYVLVFRKTERGSPENYSVDMFSVLVEVFHTPYFSLFGQLDPHYSDIAILDAQANNLTKEDPGYYYKLATSHFIFPVFQGVYLLLSTVLLLNLLIALFSYSINEVQEKAQQLWTFSRHDLILEYFARPILPQPFSLIPHLFRVLKWMARKCCCVKREVQIVCRKSFVAFLHELENGDEVKKMLRRWEKTISNSYFVEKTEKERRSVTERLISMERKLDELTNE